MYEINAKNILKEGQFWDLQLAVLILWLFSDFGDRRNLEIYFPRFFILLLKKASQNKWIFDQNRITFTKKDKNGKQIEEVTLVDYM